MPKKNIPVIIRPGADRLNNIKSPVNFLGDKIKNNATLRTMLEETWGGKVNIQLDSSQQPTEKYYRIIDNIYFIWTAEPEKLKKADSQLIDILKEYKILSRKSKQHNEIVVIHVAPPQSANQALYNCKTSALEGNQTAQITHINFNLNSVNDAANALPYLEAHQKLLDCAPKNQKTPIIFVSNKNDRSSSILFLMLSIARIKKENSNSFISHLLEVNKPNSKLKIVDIASKINITAKVKHKKRCEVPLNIVRFIKSGHLEYALGLLSLKQLQKNLDTYLAVAMELSQYLVAKTNSPDDDKIVQEKYHSYVLNELTQIKREIQIGCEHLDPASLNFKLLLTELFLEKQDWKKTENLEKLLTVRNKIAMIEKSYVTTLIKSKANSSVIEMAVNSIYFAQILKIINNIINTFHKISFYQDLPTIEPLPDDLAENANPLTEQPQSNIKNEIIIEEILPVIEETQLADLAHDSIKNEPSFVAPSNSSSNLPPPPPLPPVTNCTTINKSTLFQNIKTVQLKKPNETQNLNNQPLSIEDNLKLEFEKFKEKVNYSDSEQDTSTTGWDEDSIVQNDLSIEESVNHNESNPYQLFSTGKRKECDKLSPHDQENKHQKRNEDDCINNNNSAGYQSY